MQAAYGDDGIGIISTSWALLMLSMAKCKVKDEMPASIP
jgi:hypothetical protein